MGKGAPLAELVSAAASHWPLGARSHPAPWREQLPALHYYTSAVIGNPRGARSRFPQSSSLPPLLAPSVAHAHTGTPAEGTSVERRHKPRGPDEPSSPPFSTALAPSWGLVSPGPRRPRKGPTPAVPPPPAAPTFLTVVPPQKNKSQNRRRRRGINASRLTRQGE